MNETEELDKDEVFEVLSSTRRRQILYHLHRRGGEAHLRDLARDTAVSENETPVGEGGGADGADADPISEDVVKRFYISLYQTHVPKLEEAGLVRYDGDKKLVTLTDRVSEIARVLNKDTTPDRRWELYYAALAVAGITLAAAQSLTAVPPITTLVFTVVLLALAAFQYYETTAGQGQYDFLEHLVSD